MASGLPRQLGNSTMEFSVFDGAGRCVIGVDFDHIICVKSDGFAWKACHAFSVSANSFSPVGCQWFFNDTTSLPNANSTTFSLASALPADAGAYRAVVTNAYGSVTNTQAALFASESSARSLSVMAVLGCSRPSVFSRILRTR